MRQAGRYLPEYRAVREKYLLEEMFFTPEIAAEITLMPIQRFGFDAAILFSDITIIAPALGLKLVFNEGPHVTPFVTPENISQLPLDIHTLQPIFDTIRLVKQQLSVPLIGFCGGPYTVATYLMGEQSWEKHPSFGKLIDRLTEVSILYLQQQIAAGADVVQVFDSWANRLDGEEFEKYSLGPLRKIVQSVNKPVIVFMRGSARRAEQIAQLGCAISIDSERPLADVRSQVALPLQGNLDPEVLLSPETTRRATLSLLDTMHADPSFILNLGHGILPNTPLESVYALIDTVNNYSLHT